MSCDGIIALKITYLRKPGQRFFDTTHRVKGGMMSTRQIKAPVTFVLGIFITIFGLYGIEVSRIPGKIIPLFIGLSLIYLGWRGGRRATAIFGHITIVCGCFLITWGLYLLPYAKPTLSHIFGFPLFWGFFALFGGICAIYHAFCNCVKCPKNE